MKRLFLIKIFLLVFSTATSISLEKISLINQSKGTEAIQRIKERIDSLGDDTSCKVASKFMLLTLANIKQKREMAKYKLTNDLKLDLLAIKKLLKEGYILHMEVKTNHHFIIFLKNEKDLYLLHAFQDRWKLIDWLSHKEVINTYLTIDDFIANMFIMLNKQSQRDKVNQAILNLFLPSFFNTNPKDIRSLLKYFKGDIKLVNVNYASFDFSIKNKGEQFVSLNDKVIKSYVIAHREK